MWIPTHNRHGKKANSTRAILSLLVFSCAGCTQLPKFEPRSTADQFAEVDGRIPAPIFDDVALAGSSGKSVRVASSIDGRGIVAEVGPFEWQPIAKSAGGRDIQGLTVGQGGYRSLILGSLAGDDPLAIQLTEDLAKHIHTNSIILGGIAATVVRNTNPDGQAVFRMENASGVYLNRQFPTSKDISQDLLKREPEVRFVLGLLEERQPQRVIHIRSTPDEIGMIASSSGAQVVAEDACDWLGFDYIKLPGNSANGTLERFLSAHQTCEIITIAIPQTSKKSELWDRYGDTILNLLLDDDYETRKLARTQKAQEFADRRIVNPTNEFRNRDK